VTARYLLPLLALVLSVAVALIGTYGAPGVPEQVVLVMNYMIVVCPFIYVAATAWLAWSLSTPRGEARAPRLRRMGLLALAAPPVGLATFILATAKDVAWMVVPILVAPLLVPVAICAWGLWRLGRSDSVSI
jgi:hypothetical protein